MTKKLYILLLGLLCSVLAFTDTTRTIYFCESVTLNGQTYYSSTVVRDTVHLPSHIDSIYVYYLVKGESFHVVDNISLQQGDTTYWHGQQITNGTTYYDSHMSIAGCDSTYELHVTLLPVVSPQPVFTENAHICEGDVYTWPRNGKDYRQASTYSCIVPAVAPDTTDTTYILNLTVYPAYDTLYLHLYNCNGSTITYGGKDYTSDTTITTNYPSRYGCDSVTVAYLHFNSASFLSDTMRLADTDTSRVWHGQHIHHAGTYYYDELLPGGCYRREELVVFMYPTFLLVRDTAICQNQAPYVWKYPAPADWYNKSFSCAPGETIHKEWSAKTVNGVDSIYRLTLTVYPNYTTRERVVLCEGDKATVNGKTYKDLKPNIIYRDTAILQSVNECDSVIYYEITQFPTKHTSTTQILYVGDTVFWYGDTLTTAGVYPHTEKQAACNCDSIIELNLIAETPHYATICQLDTPYLWHNRKFYTSGVWLDTVRENGFITQFHSLHLTVTEPVDTTIELRGCLPAGVTFNGKTYTESQREVLDTLNCDTIFHLNITIDPKISITYFDTICETELPYILGKKNPEEIREEGTHTHKEKTACGCDSTVTVHLSIIPSFNRNDSVVVCESNISTEHPYIYHNLKYTHDTIVWNCSKTNYFHLIVGPPSIKDSIYYLCELDTLHFGYWSNGQRRLITHEGVYYDTLKTVLDPLLCDSIIKLTVFMRPAYRDTTVKHIHQGDSILWGGTYKRFSGFYSDSLTLMPDMDSKGDYCKSVHTLHLFVDSTYLKHDTISVCSTKGNTLSHTWFDGHVQKFSTPQSGEWTHFYDSLLTAAYHFDSIYDLYVFAQPVYETHVHFQTCAGDSIQYNHKKYRQPGIFRDTLQTVHECDSVIVIHYTWNETYYIRKTAQTDDKTPYVWKLGDGSTRTLTSSGVYFDSLKTTSSQCDSIIELTLTVYPTYYNEEQRIICASETPYVWHNKQCWTTGTYRDSMQTQMHYDSIFVLNLTVIDTTYGDIRFSICHGESFVYNGKTYSHGGIWTDTLSAANGCDSIVVIHVQELPKYLFSDTAAVANRQPYVWRGQTLTHTGIYRDTIGSSTGCDSVYQLVLTIYDKEQFRDTTIIACENSLPIQWRTRWLSDDTTFYDTITTGDVDTIWQVNLHVVRMEYQTIEHVLCQGDVYHFNGKDYTKDTLLHETIYSGYGCGTEYTLFLRFRKPHILQFDAKTSSNKPYKWNVEDTTYSFRFSGNYEHIVRTKDNQCDSIIYQLHLTVGSVYLFKDSTDLCQSDLPYKWHNQLIYDTGTYYDSLQTQMGYDSVYMLKVLQILPAYYEEQVINLCEGAGAFYYRGKAYNHQGVFFDTIPSINGCDSIFKITVRVMPTYEIYDTVHISDKETYPFYGRDLSISGPYEHYGKTKAECDSIIHLQLYVHPSYLFSQEEEICNKDTFMWRGKPYYKEGVYYDSLLSVQGYDSVYKLTLTVYPTYFKEESIEICPNTSTWLHEMNISEPGVYWDTLYTTHGCDSIFKITVNLKRSFRQEFSAEICQGEEYIFFGVPYSKSGTYKYEIGCDSIITMHLTVHPRSITEKRVVISQEELPYRYNGEEYWETKIYVDTFKNIYACDSIFKLNLIVSEHVSEWEQIPLCPGAEIRIDDQIITEAGDYTFLRRSKVSGLMDSLYRIEVYNAPAYEIWDTITICQGDTVIFDGKPITRAGAYTESKKTYLGCDSIRHLFLIINPTYTFTTIDAITDYQTYTWRGKEYNEAGTYYQSYPTIDDCDSSYVLELSIVPTQRYMDSTAICLNSSIVWRGRELSDPGIYNDTVCNLASLTSIIYTLKLTVVTPTIITKASITDVSADAESFNIDFTYSGLRPERYSITFDDLAHQQGFIDITDEPFGPEVVAVVPIPHTEEIIYKDHTAYVRPNIYTMRLSLDNGVCGLSRSDSLTLRIRYPSWVLEQNWDNVVVPLRKEYNGGYEFGNYAWYINDMPYNNNGSPYLYTNTLKRGDKVVLYATRVGESYAIPTAPLEIKAPEPNVFDNPVLVYPTSTSKAHATVKLKAETDGTYNVYTPTGQLYSTGNFTRGTQTINVPATAGCCFVKTTTDDGQITTTKIIVY